MTIQDYRNESKIITLSKEFDSRAKVLNVVYFFVFTAAFLPMLLRMLPDFFDELWLSLVMLGLSGAYLFAAYKFLNKAFQTEKLIVSKDSLTIRRTGFFSRQERTYTNTFISGLTHVEKPTLTRHPLAGQSFDYLGFQTGQAVINEMHGDKRISFMYEGRKVAFGENVYSWEFDELVLLLYNVTQNDFRYTDEMEKEMFAGDEGFMLDEATS